MTGGEIDQFSLALGRFEEGIDALKETTKDLTEKFAGIITTVHLQGERLDKVEVTTELMHQHHIGRTAIVRFLKTLPYATIYAVIGGGLGTVASQWKVIVGLLR